MNLLQRIKLKLSVEWLVLRPFFAKYIKLLIGGLAGVAILFFNGYLRKAINDTFSTDNNRELYRQIKTNKPAYTGDKDKILDVPEIPRINKYNERERVGHQNKTTINVPSINDSINLPTIPVPTGSSDIHQKNLKDQE